uniref:Uncharacterized protein LOC116306834 n=1 Tax=Actinia tenebrosa TaxID=6105 RepID=A0A6P8J606_ACTTE
MSSQVQEEVEKLKELYKTSSRALENWPKSDHVSSCDDKAFVELLEELTDLELEAAVHGLQRQIEVELLLVKNLERLRIINSGECPDTNSKLISSQTKVARLRSRLLRCLSKQLNNQGHKESVLPPWHSKIGNEEVTTATTAETQNDTTTGGPGDVRDGSAEIGIAADQPTDSGEDNQLYKSGSTTSGSSEHSEVEGVSFNKTEIENLHWVEPKDLSTTSPVSKGTECESSSKEVGNVAKDKSPQKDAPEKGSKPAGEENGKKKIQETLEKNLHEKGHNEHKKSISESDVSPPPKPPPYSSQEKKNADLKALFPDDEDMTDGYLMTEQPQMRDWDPTLLLQDLFVDKKDNETKEEQAAAAPEEPPSFGVVRMAGYMDKLPSTYKQKKSTVFKGWKKRHFKAFDGQLFYFEDHRNHEPLGMVDLEGCSVVISGERMLELIDSEGKAALKVRCATPAEAQDWKEAIEEEAKTKITQNVECTDSSPEGSVIVIDLGSSSVKAGFASEEAWPQVVFPCVCAELKEDESDCVYGFDALVPERRKKSILRFPLRRSLKIDKLKFSPSALTGILEHVFSMLKVNPAKHKVIMTLPQNTSLNEKGELVDILLGFFGVEACYLQHQSILALYSYSAVSGIIVDIGDHIDVIPVVEGCVIEAGASRLPYGGRQITDMLARLLTEKGHRFFAEVESYITRYIKEKACYVSESKTSDDEDMPCHPIDVMLAKYNIPDGTKKVTFDTARYRCTEGLFKPHVWGKDHPGIQDLTYKAIMACSMDVRKQMCRSIYLSGGGSMLPGFPERLQTEVSALLPPHNIVQVHAGTDRHYSAFIGASVVANLPLFEEHCITQDDWNDIGVDALEKWENL